VRCSRWAEAPRPCSSDELAVVAKLLEEQEIPEAKIWLYAGLSVFLFLYTSILGFSSSRSNVVKILILLNNTFHGFDCL
jgi:mevalonate kinase